MRRVLWVWCALISSHRLIPAIIERKDGHFIGLICQRCGAETKPSPR